MSRAAIGPAMAAALALAPLVAACGDDGGGDSPDAAPACAVPPGTGPGLPATGFCAKLSEYRLFDDLAAQDPADGVRAFDLAVPLFSDYTDKHRWLYVPPGAQVAWQDVDAFDLPVGSILVKSFAYLNDRRTPSAGRRLLETRLLLHQADGWHGASYVYGDDDHDAELAIAGATIDATWIHDDGATRTNRYAVPDLNQCANCHGEHDHVNGPLGPKARHLNRDAADGSGNQLTGLIAAGILTGAPADMATWPADPAIDDSGASLEARARAWLDINCAHCHNPRGAARTSGLDLSITQTDPVMYGICKTPVAAGPGSGGLSYGIVPGAPDQSILVFRLASTQPQIRMPELGRNLVHEEGLALIRAWIAAMPPDDCVP